MAIYQVAGSALLSASAVDNGNTAKCAYFGLPGVTNISFATATNFTGTIYAPSANLTANLGGFSRGFAGSCIVKSIVMTGAYTFHFDENLLRVGAVR